MPFNANGTATNECPVSLITAKSEELIQVFAKSKALASFGATPYGNNLAKWPAKMVEAFVILEEEQAKTDRMMLSKKKR